MFEGLRAADVPGKLTLEEAIDAYVASIIPQMITHRHGIFTFNTVPPEVIDWRVAVAGRLLRLTRARTQVEYGL